MSERPDGPFLLFVYGTLKRGGCRHGVLAGQPYRGEARTRPSYALYHLGAYPGLRHAEAGQVVRGELYEVSPSRLAELDRVEGAPDWFDLAPVELDGVDAPVWAYYYQGDAGGRERIESGTWDDG